MKISFVYLVLGFNLACSDSTYPVVVEDIASEYWELSVNHLAIQMSTLAPYDTLSLRAIPVRFDGSEIQIDSNVRANNNLEIEWVSNDSSAVYVDQNGFITAKKDAFLVELTVSYKLSKVTRHATIHVRVKTDSQPASLDVFTIRPTDSLKRAALNLYPPYTFPYTATDSKGNVITDLPVYWKSSNSKIATITGPWEGRLELNTPGTTVLITAHTWFYGSTHTDSFTLEVGYPVAYPLGATELKQMANERGIVEYRTILSRPSIGPGGAIEFLNNTAFGPKNILGVPPLPGVNISVIFDDSTLALEHEVYPGDPRARSGNIYNLPKDTSYIFFSDRQAYRKFIKPGEHFYTIQPFGVRGSIYVHEK